MIKPSTTTIINAPNGLPTPTTNPSKLFLITAVEPKDEIDLKMQHCYAVLTVATLNLTERELHDTLNAIVCKGAQQYEEICFGLLYTILTEPTVCQRAFRDLMLISRDGFNIVLTKINQIVCEKWLKLTETGIKQIIWFTNECVKNLVIGIDSVFFYIIRQMISGDLSPKNIRLIETILDILIGNEEWLGKNAHLVSFVLYTYLRFIEDHFIPVLNALRLKEIDFCIKLLRNHFLDCMVIGRDLIRLLQNVARIPEFDMLWQDIMFRPQALIPNVPNILKRLIMTKTPRKFPTSRIPPDLENKLVFLLNKVKYNFKQTSIENIQQQPINGSPVPPLGNNLRRYQDWLVRCYDLSNPKRASLVCDIIRYVCCVIHPSNEILCSDITPRWALIGWLLLIVAEGKTISQFHHFQSQLHHQVNVIGLSHCKNALFYDWFGYDPKRNGDSIMNVEPSILLINHNLRTHPAMAQSLLEFLCLVARDFAGQHLLPPGNFSSPSSNALLTELADVVRDSVRRCLKDILEKRVIHSLDSILKFEQLDKEIAYLFRETFAIGDTIEIVPAKQSAAINNEEQHQVELSSNNDQKEIQNHSYTLPITPPRSTAESPPQPNEDSSVVGNGGQNVVTETFSSSSSTFKRRRSFIKRGETDDITASGNAIFTEKITMAATSRQRKRIAQTSASTLGRHIKLEQDELEEGRFSDSEESIGNTPSIKGPPFSMMIQSHQHKVGGTTPFKEISGDHSEGFKIKRKNKKFDKYLKMITGNQEIKGLLKKFRVDSETFSDQALSHFTQSSFKVEPRDDNLDDELTSIEPTKFNLANYLREQTNTLRDILNVLYRDPQATNDVKSLKAIGFCLTVSLKPYYRTKFIPSTRQSHFSHLLMMDDNNDIRYSSSNIKDTFKKTDKANAGQLFKEELLKLDYQVLPILYLVSQYVTRSFCPTKTNARTEIWVLNKLLGQLHGLDKRFGYWFLYGTVALHLRSSWILITKPQPSGGESTNFFPGGLHQHQRGAVDSTNIMMNERDFWKLIDFRPKHDTNPTLGEFLTVYADFKGFCLENNFTSPLQPRARAMERNNSLNNNPNKSKTATLSSSLSYKAKAAFYQDLHSCYERDSQRFKFIITLIYPTLLPFFWETVSAEATNDDNDNNKSTPLKVVSTYSKHKKAHKAGGGGGYMGASSSSSSADDENPNNQDGGSSGDEGSSAYGSEDSSSSFLDDDTQDEEGGGVKRRTLFYRDIVASLEPQNLSRIILSQNCRDRSIEDEFWYGSVYGNFELSGSSFKSASVSLSSKLRKRKRLTSNNMAADLTKKKDVKFFGEEEEDDQDDSLMIIDETNSTSDEDSSNFGGKSSKVVSAEQTKDSSSSSCFAFDESSHSNANAQAFVRLIESSQLPPLPTFTTTSSIFGPFRGRTTLQSSALSMKMLTLSEFYDSTLVRALFRVSDSSLADIIEDSMRWDPFERRTLWDLLLPFFHFMLIEDDVMGGESSASRLRTDDKDIKVIGGSSGYTSNTPDTKEPGNNNYGNLFYRFLLQNDVLDIEFEEDPYVLEKIVNIVTRLKPDTNLVKALMKRENEFSSSASVSVLSTAPASFNNKMAPNNLKLGEFFFHHHLPTLNMNLATAVFKAWTSSDKVMTNNVEALAEIFATFLNGYIDPRFRPKNLSSTRVKEPSPLMMNDTAAKSHLHNSFNFSSSSYVPSLETLLEHLEALRSTCTVFTTSHNPHRHQLNNSSPDTFNETYQHPNKFQSPTPYNNYKATSVMAAMPPLEHVPTLLKHDLVRLALQEVRAVCQDTLRHKFRHLFSVAEMSRLEETTDDNGKFSRGKNETTTSSSYHDKKMSKKTKEKSSFSVSNSSNKKATSSRPRYDNQGEEYLPEDEESDSDEERAGAGNVRGENKSWDGSSCSPEDEVNEEDRILRDLGSASMSPSTSNNEEEDCSSHSADEARRDEIAGDGSGNSNAVSRKKNKKRRFKHQHDNNNNNKQRHGHHRSKYPRGGDSPTRDQKKSGSGGAPNDVFSNPRKKRIVSNVFNSYSSDSE